MSVAQSPLFEPVLWEGSGFRILDEIQVPERIVYLRVDEVEQALDAVREMKTRAFGQVLTFLYSAALVGLKHATADAHELGLRIDSMTEQFCAARPTFDFRGLRVLFEPCLREPETRGKAAESIASWARELGQRIVGGRRARARLAASVLPGVARVLTHCNVSGELVAVAQHCQELGKEFSVIATETRPYLQGSRLTAWELARAGVKVSVIPDNAVTQVMQHGEINAVIVGADRVAQNGDIVNKIGTYTLALMAKHFDIPFYPLVQDPRSLARGDDVVIEERPASELLKFDGRSLIESHAIEPRVRYPAFDVTPATLITRWIGFDAIYTAETFVRKYQKATAADRPTERPSARYLLVYGVPPESHCAYLSRLLAAEGLESVLVPEMRPELWGTKLVIPALLERGIPTTLISDNMMGRLFAEGAIRKLGLFYDALTEQGVHAICGAQMAALLARTHNIDVELFQAAAERPAMEDRDVGTFLGRRIRPPGAKVHPTGAEAIPWKWLASGS